MKTAIIFCFSNRLPKVTARPFSSRTSSCETERIVSWEGISRRLLGGIGVEMGGREGVRTNNRPLAILNGGGDHAKWL